MSTPDLREQVRAQALALGFELCRFAPAETPVHADALRHWLSEGRAGEMTYLERNADKRCDPQAVLPGAKTVIVLALNYYQGAASEARPSVSVLDANPAKTDAPGPESALPAADTVSLGAPGRIARYAWGDDYHSLLDQKLAELARFLGGLGGRQKCYVDTGPVLERDHAAAAGIGWQGKSTMLLNSKLGTWFFLAEILTTLEFSADLSVPNRCGKCTRCLDACPTGALTSSHQLDARRCISYLTIELKGSIPLELRPLLGNRIYGCDDCLEACPWNRFAQVSRESTFALPPEIAEMRLRDYLELTEERFRALFRRSPIKRTKRRGLLRNVCVALGNVGTVDDLPSLERACADPEPIIAEHAHWAIAQISARMQSSAPKGSAVSDLGT